MPGTAGTAACAVLVLLLDTLFNLEPVLIILAAIVSVCGTIAINKTLDTGIYRSKKDPQEIVIDEFAGFLITLIGFEISWLSLLTAFLAFRAFDITKPPPVSHLENLPRGYGIMLDDIAAGILANIALRLLSFVGLLQL